PKNVDAQVILGNALAGLKDLDGAVKEMEEALKLDPDRSQTYSNLAMLRMAQGQKDQARAAFERAVEIDPKSIPSWLALANFQWSNGEQMEAEASLKRAIAIDPNNVLANRVLASLYMGTNREAEAEAPLKVIAAASKVPAPTLNLADYYLSQNKLDAAKNVLEPLVKDPRAQSAAE